MKTIFFLLMAWTNLSIAAIKVAITVDDLPFHGPLPTGVTRESVTAKMLAAFKKHKVPEAYAFINAGKIKEGDDGLLVLKMWRDAGYPLANHTFTHPSLHESATDFYKKDIRKNEKILSQLNGDSDWHYFRYPYLREGETLEKRNEIRGFLKENKYTIAQVTIDFEDWSWNSPYARCKDKGETESIAWLEKTYLQNADDMLDRAEKLSAALFKRPIGHILLLHIGAFDAEMLDQLLTRYEKKGVEFITLGEASQDEIYNFDPQVVGKFGSEFTYQVLKARKLSLKDVGLTKYEAYPESTLETLCK